MALSTKFEEKTVPKGNKVADLDKQREKSLPSLGPIEDSARTDYRYRRNAPQAETSTAVAKMIADIDYSNFTDQAHNICHI